MLNRCRNQNIPKFKSYGGRGISVCAGWHKFARFQEWAIANGYRDDLTIERKDNDGNYCPENCTWIPAAQQARNTQHTRRLTFNGERLSLVEWAERTGIAPATIAARIKRLRWSVERTLTVPVAACGRRRFQEGA
jgi:hypothetical protein